jgi:hypothetical protein
MIPGIMSSTVETDTSSHHFAVLISLMVAPHRGGNLLRPEGYAHAAIFVANSQIDVKQLVLQTIFLAVPLAVTVNLQPRRK